MAEKAKSSAKRNINGEIAAKNNGVIEESVISVSIMAKISERKGENGKYLMAAGESAANNKAGMAEGMAKRNIERNGGNERRASEWRNQKSS